jgi:alanyl-tRNA synthetase
MMLFGEQYGDRVRMITFDPEYSMELCGGTHVDATGEIGYFRFIQETSAAAGVRRVEAVTGYSADAYLRNEKTTLESIKHEIGQSQDLVKDIHTLIEENKELEKEVERLRLQNSSAKLDQLIDQARTTDEGVRIVTGEIPGVDMDMLKQLGSESRNKCKETTVTVLGSKDNDEGKVYLVAALSDDLVQDRGLKAGDLVGKLGQIVGGGGGGQPQLATAGGRQPDKLQEAFDAVEELVSQD